MKLTPTSTTLIENMKIVVNCFLALHMSIVCILNYDYRILDMLTISGCNIYRARDILVELLNQIFYVTLNTKPQNNSPS